ncbi:ThiF family adenylyltransferase [Massilia sp. B-10]|nr:ThiF family adenylyltransferase [Massilia sp. B-10]
MGCGLGASTAIAATRMGFQHFVLIDGDTVDAHNLNRQFYDFDDVGTPKVSALKKHILRINPEARVEAVQANLDKGNAVDLVGQVDIIFDTIDFLDLEAILALHMSAQAQGKAVFTALSIGFGAKRAVFPGRFQGLAGPDHRERHCRRQQRGRSQLRGRVWQDHGPHRRPSRPPGGRAGGQGPDHHGRWLSRVRPRRFRWAASRWRRWRCP